MKIRIVVCCLLLFVAAGISGHSLLSKAAGATERVAKQGVQEVQAGCRKSVQKFKADFYQGEKG